MNDMLCNLIRKKIFQGGFDQAGNNKVNKM